MPIVSAGFDAPLFKGTYFRDLQTQIASAVGSGLSTQVVMMAMNAGMHPQDVAFLSRYSQGSGFLIIIRCPRQSAFAYQGVRPAKPANWQIKSDADGVARRDGVERVSDYDLMSFYENAGGALRKIVIAAATWDGVPTGAKQGPYTGKATLILREMNKVLRSRLQHGCQDDFASTKNPGVKQSDRFIAFKFGQVVYLASAPECCTFYLMHGLNWLYDPRPNESGVYAYIGPIGAKGG